MSKLDDSLRLSLELARNRALHYLVNLNLDHGVMLYTKASSVADQIWPGHSMKAQGAGAAASRVLKSLERDGLVVWHSNVSDWGWDSTPIGRGRVLDGDA